MREARDYPVSNWPELGVPELQQLNGGACLEFSRYRRSDLGKRAGVQMDSSTTNPTVLTSVPPADGTCNQNWDAFRDKIERVCEWPLKVALECE